MRATHHAAVFRLCHTKFATLDSDTRARAACSTTVTGATGARTERRRHAASTHTVGLYTLGVVCYCRTIFFFFFFSSLLAIIIVTGTHIFTALLQDPRCLYEPKTTKKTSKKVKNNQHRQGRLILFVRSSHYKCVCIINERSFSYRYCSCFVLVRVPGEIDGQVNDLSSALVRALLRRRLKNYNMRFDRKKGPDPHV